MNKKQKYFLVIGIILIAAALIYWFTQGAEILTKTQVLVDQTSDLDKMLGVKNEQYVDKFVFGLLGDYVYRMDLLHHVQACNCFIRNFYLFI